MRATSEPIAFEPKWTPAMAHAFAMRALRADFLAQPLTKQAETRSRALQRAREHPNSYLAKHVDAIYGPRWSRSEI